MTDGNSESGGVDGLLDLDAEGTEGTEEFALLRDGEVILEMASNDPSGAGAFARVYSAKESASTQIVIDATTHLKVLDSLLDGVSRADANRGTRRGRYTDSGAS